MNFLISNPELDAQIKEIKLQIRLSMNGIVSDQMKAMGVCYKQNFGVAIPRLKEIAQKHTPNHDLAQRLWLLQIRETMILATLLQPAEQFTPAIANKWMESITQIEMVEQLNMNLLSKTDYAREITLAFIKSDNIWLQIAGFNLGCRAFSIFSEEDIDTILTYAHKYAHTEEFQLYKNIGLCLSRLCRNSTTIAHRIRAFADEFDEKATNGQKTIAGEIKQELQFLNIL